MKPRLNNDGDASPSAEEHIHGRGLRMTDQRRAVYDALMIQRDHPTAVEVFTRVKTKMPSISLATVYNCLETLTDCGIVKAVNHDREPSRYCPNLADHAHLYCDSCGGVMDIPLRSERHPHDMWDLPPDVTIIKQEVSFRGLCPKCATTSVQSPAETRSK